MSFYLKDPHSRVDYAIDWGASYLGEQIVAGSAWSVEPVEPGGIAVDAASFEPTRTAATLVGGVPGHVYSVGNHVILSDGRSDDRSLTLRVEQR